MRAMRRTTYVLADTHCCITGGIVMDGALSFCEVVCLQ